MASPVTTVLVVGGGISGLACAWRLKHHGLPVLLAERDDRLGGLIDTVRQDGFLFDIGPQSFLGSGAVLDLVDELGLSAEVQRADQRAPRYILRKGRLVRAPLGPGSLLRSPLISWKTKFCLVGDALFRSYPPDDDETIADFVRRKFGPDLLANLVGPFISGIYAGDPERLSLEGTFPALRRLEERYGSVLRGLIKSQRPGGAERPSLCNFRRGVSALPASLAVRLGKSARPGLEAVSIRRRVTDGSPAFDVTCRERGESRPLVASAVVLATPAGAAAQLLSEVEPKFVDPLSVIFYAPVAEVVTVYRAAQVSSRSAPPSAGGFGFLVPRTEGLRILGTVWNSSLFPGRVPRGPDEMVSFTSFIGGATDPDICAQPAEEVVATVCSELGSVLGISGPPAVTHLTRWERALPQYNLGHAKIVSELDQLSAATPGVFLVGNYFSGPSIGSCIERAGRVADAIAKCLGAPA